MNIALTNKDIVVQLTGDLTIYTAAENCTLLKDILLDSDNSGLSIKIDLSQIYEIDTAGLQILWMIKTQATRFERKLDYEHASSAVRDLCQLYRCDVLLSN